MALSYDFYFNSGADNTDHFQEGDNVSLIEINNSDNDYYQNGIISVFGTNSSQTIGDTVLFEINGVRQFSGYVARREQSIQGGKNIYTYQLIGKTYDLWRYHTGVNALYSGLTGHIASSLISEYCEGISGAHIWTSGINLTNDIDLSNTIIGDALVRLTEIDGYKFYVDEDDELHYYKPKQGLYNFTVQETDILEMSPIEQADEDLVNDVLVIGGTDYSAKTIVSPNPPSSNVIPSGILVAQKFTAEADRLAAVKLYLGRSEGDNQPDSVDFEIWADGENLLFDDEFGDQTYIESHHNTEISDQWTSEEVLDYLRLVDTSQPAKSWDGRKGGDLGAGYARYNATTFTTAGSDFTVARAKMIGVRLGGGGDGELYTLEVQGVDGDHKPNGNIIASADSIRADKQSEYHWFIPERGKTCILKANTQYALVLYGVNSAHTCRQSWEQSEPTEPGEYWFSSPDKVTWTPDSESRTGRYIVAGFIVKSSGYTISKEVKTPCRHIKINLSDYYISTAGNASVSFAVSGTNDGGSSWQKIFISSSTDCWNSSNIWWDFGSESSDGVKVKYCFNSDGSNYPILNRCSVYTGTDVTGPSGGIPASGTKIEHSDDITFSYNDVPYQPSWSSWKTYSEPKLGGDDIVDGSSYWMILNHMSSNSKYWKYYYNPKNNYVGEGIQYSWNNGVKWSSNKADPTQVPSGCLSFQLGWSEGEITATAVNEVSIDAFGRYFKTINDSSILTLEQAQARADFEVSGMETIPRKGSVTINGRSDMETHYRFSSNLTNYDIDEIWDIVSYTQRIDNNGFTTIINYGKQPYDITKSISNLEKEVF